MSRSTLLYVHVPIKVIFIVVLYTDILILRKSNAYMLIYIHIIFLFHFRCSTSIFKNNILNTFHFTVITTIKYKILILHLLLAKKWHHAFLTRWSSHGGLLCCRGCCRSRRFLRCDRGAWTGGRCTAVPITCVHEYEWKYDWCLLQTSIINIHILHGVIT